MKKIDGLPVGNAHMPGPDIAKRLEKLGVPVAKLIAQYGHAGADG
jgi:hypothetical protein